MEILWKFYPRPEVLKEDGRVDWNMKNEEGDTPVMQSVFLERREKANILLDIPSVDLDIRNPNGDHLEDMARYSGIFLDPVRSQ